MKMRRAVARAVAPRMAAKGDGFALRVAAVGVAAVAGFEIDQGEMPRHDLDTAEFCRFRPFENRRRPRKPGCPALARLAAWRFFRFRRPLGPMLELVPGPARPTRTDKPHAPGAAKRGT